MHMFAFKVINTAFYTIYITLPTTIHFLQPMILTYIVTVSEVNISNIQYICTFHVVQIIVLLQIVHGHKYINE